MLRKKDLEEKQKTFFYDNKGYWIDFPICCAVIKQNNGKMAFYSHCEISGELELTCEYIDDIDHLDFLYEILSGEKLKIVK